MPIPTVSTNYGEKVYEGKAKIVYRSAQGSYLHYFKDSATAFNAVKKASFAGKGSLNAHFSAFFFQHLTKAKVPHHFLRLVDDRTIETMALQMIPLEIVVRNRVAGSLAKRLGEKEGRVLPEPMIEFFVKDDAKGDPQISEAAWLSFRSKSNPEAPKELAEMKRLALLVNSALRPLLNKKGLDLVDFKIEVGFDGKGILRVADEISPDTARIWDLGTGERLDKDLFRFDLGDLLQGYRKVMNRLTDKPSTQQSGAEDHGRPSR